MTNDPWLGRVGTLNVSRSQSRGPAPHKPLMLLTVMDLAEAGEIGPDGWVAYDVRLVSRFRDYWDGSTSTSTPAAATTIPATGWR